MTRRTLLGIGMSIITVWSAGAQSTATRTPNIDDGWTVEPGTLQFNFVHRFVRSDAPVRKVTSFPSFFLATGLPGGFNGGLVYSTNSTVFAGIPNEYEFRLRRPLARDGAIDATITAAYNASSQSIDGELGLGRSLGPVHFLGVVRAMSSGFDAQRPLIGAGEGVVVHFNQTFSLTGDYFAILNARGDPNLHSVWGAGLAVQIPYTPHSLAIEITNSTTATIEGSSVGTPSGYKIGFEFTIPITLKRYFGARAKPVTADTATAPPPAPEPTPRPPADTARPPMAQPVARSTKDPTRMPADTPRVVPPADTTPKPASRPAPKPARAALKTITIHNFTFGPAAVHVAVGTRVRWLNHDPIQHTVSADNGTFTSALISPESSFTRVFQTPGRYRYHCSPHPFMHGTIIVDPAPPTP